MQPNHTFSVSIVCTLPRVEAPSPTAEQEFFVHFHDFLGPEFFGVEDIGRE